MDWVLWLVALTPLGLPVGVLMVDRILGIPAPKLFTYLGIPATVVYLGLGAYAVAAAHPLLELLGWGLIGGIIATAFLDVVRLIGVRFHAFPMDMPVMFGVISLGLAPRLQQNMIGAMVGAMAELPPARRRAMMAERLRALPRLPEPQRVMVVGAMRKGLARLPEEARLALMTTQMELLSELPGEARRKVMAAIDAAMLDGAGTYGQPRGMPQIPMASFRQLMGRAYPRTLAEGGISHRTVAWRGYLWHFLIGSTFGITYTLLFGSGSWPLAFGWGIFVWFSMMVSMPPMMPLVKFSWWFPIVPFLAHLAMAIPIGHFAGFVSPAGTAVSLLGLLR